MKCVSLQPSKLTEAFKYFIQGMGYSKCFIIEKYHTHTHTHTHTHKKDEIKVLIYIWSTIFILQTISTKY